MTIADDWRVSAQGREVSLGDPEGAAMFLADTLAEDPTHDTRKGRAIRMLLAERERWEGDVPLAVDIAGLPFLSSFLRGVLHAGDPEASAAVVAVGVLGAGREAAGKGVPGKAWGNVCYRELVTFMRRVERLAATEERCER